MGQIIVTYLILGFVLVGLGIAAYFYPWFLSGLNQLTSEQKRKYNEKRLKKGLALGLLSLAIVPLIFAFLPDDKKHHIMFLAFFFGKLLIFIISINRPYFKQKQQEDTQK